MNPDDLFTHWRTHRGSDAYDPLSAKGARSYAAIWVSWVRWLTQQDQDKAPRAASYLDATAIQIANFLISGPTPRSARRAHKPLSEITRRRYWRVLDSIYGHAQNLHLIDHNPASGLCGPDKPPPEKPVGQVFDVRQLSALVAAFPEGPNVWKLRDRAMLELMINEAFSVAELCALSIGDLSKDLLDRRLFVVRLDGKRKAQQRTVSIGQEASAVLSDWLATRDAKDPAQNAPVFITERLRRISPRVVFHLVSTTVVRSFLQASLELPLHIGPQVLRNTCIVNWVNSGMHIDVALMRAGLKDQNSLRGLRTYLRPIASHKH